MPHFPQVPEALAAARPPTPPNQYSLLAYVWFGAQAIVLILIIYFVVRFVRKAIRRSRGRSM